MTHKKKSQPTEEPATQARPHMLALAVILGAAASTWYWYQPLPKDLSSEASADGFAYRGTQDQTTLIEPNTNEAIQAPTSVVPVYSNLPEDLVGDRQVQVRPFQALPQGTIQERLSKEPLPVIPIARHDRTKPGSSATLAASHPPVWTNSPSESSPVENSPVDTRPVDTRLADWDSASPLKSSAQVQVPTNASMLGDKIVAIGNPKPASAGGPATGWPDMGFNPESKLAQAKSGTESLAAANPPLTIRATQASGLAKALDRQAGKIVLAESATEHGSVDPTAVAKRKSIPTSLSQGALGVEDSSSKVKKSGAVIRQPKQQQASNSQGGSL